MLKVDKSKVKAEFQRLVESGLTPSDLSLKFSLPVYIIYNFLNHGSMGVSSAIKIAEAMDQDTKFFLIEEIDNV